MKTKMIDVLPLDHTLPDIANYVCNSKCYGCGRKIGDDEFRNPIALYEYQKTGRCQSCQDKVFFNPDKNGMNT